MRGVQAESLHDACTLRRHITNSTDEYGMPTSSYVETFYVPCGFKTKKVTEAMGNTQVDDIVAELRLLVGTNIDGLDQVTLTKRNDELIDPVVFKVEGTPIIGFSGIVIQLANFTADSPVGGNYYESDWTSFYTDLTNHINDMDNPHNTTAAQVGNGTAQWNADKLLGATVPTLASGVLTSDGATLSWEVPTLTKVAVVWDEKPQGTNGGTFTSGAWRQRGLNTKNDPSNLVSVAANAVTVLQAGNYWIRASAPSAYVSRHQCRLVLNGAYLQNGTSEYTGTQSSSTVSWVGSLSVGDILKLEHQGNANGEFGLGDASNFGVEVYSVMEIIKLN